MSQSNYPPIKNVKNFPNSNFSNILEQIASKVFGISEPGFCWTKEQLK
jgi:hypothetical protein